MSALEISSRAYDRIYGMLVNLYIKVAEVKLGRLRGVLAHAKKIDD